VTAWQDAAVGVFMGTPDTVPLYERALHEQALKVRVRGAQWWNREDGEGQLAGILERRDRVANSCDPDRFSVASVKVMVDGVAENFTAAMHAPYLDPHGHDSHNRGITFFDFDEMAEFVTALDANGVQVHFHALGDRAVTYALDALERANNANGVTDNRHHLAHLQLVRSADAVRFEPLGATANMQALWAAHESQLDQLTLPFLPADAVDHHYPFGEIAATGAHLAAGSDWPVSSADPIQVLGAESQKLTLTQIVDAYTQGTARVNHLDHVTGRLAPGYYADVAIIDQNLFELDAAKLYTARVDETWIAGERVFQRSVAAQ
jgi:predicted amidohydrolase YtcJ